MVKQATWSSSSSCCWNKQQLIRRDAAQLHNNVGALLLQRGAVEDATRHFKDAIQQHSDDGQHKTDNNNEAVAGLAWFHRKLLTEQQHGVAEQLFIKKTTEDDDDHDHNVDHHPQQQGINRARSNSSSVASVAQQPRRGCLVRSTSSSGCNNNNSSWRGNLTETTGMPTCCDGSTPLGLEYYAFPISVSSDSTTTSAAASAAAAAAAWLNLAALQYPTAKSNDDLQESLNLLHKAAATSIENNAVLSAIRDSNEGVILFRLQQTKEALVCLERAVRVVESEEFRCLLTKSDADTDDWNANPQYEYLRITVLLNHARTSVRLNADTKTATDMCHEIASCSETLLYHNSHKDHHHHHLNNMTSLILNRVRWISIVANMFVMGLVHQRQQDLPEALDCYTRFLSKARHDLGHDHLHVATVLYMKGNVLFEQRKLHHAMLAQLAALKIHESHPDATKVHLRDMARVMYSVSRTLHDREEYRDALRMYQRTLEIQKSLKLQVDVVTTMCNIARVYHIMGDLQASLLLNKQIVRLAQEMAAGKKHPFVADRLNVLGNVMVEAGQLPQAMEAFAAAARAGGNVMNLNVYDVDAQSAASLAKAGLQHPGAATA